MSRSDFTLKHIPGIKISIKNYWIHNLLEVVIKGLEVNILEKRKITKSKDKEVVSSRGDEESKSKSIEGREVADRGDLVLKEGKVYIPKNEALKVEIIQLYHDALVVEHEGKWKTTELMTRNY